jgi:hypothetical protein
MKDYPHIVRDGRVILLCIGCDLFKTSLCYYPSLADSKEWACRYHPYFRETSYLPEVRIGAEVSVATRRVAKIHNVIRTVIQTGVRNVKQGEC